MSPVMVDLGSPISNSQVQYKQQSQFQNPNPKKGQFCTPSLFFDSSVNPSPEQFRIESKPMKSCNERDAAENFVNDFPTPTRTFAMKTEKPGVLRPRLAKSRRHLAPQPGESSSRSAPQSRGDLGSTSVYPKMEVVQDQLQDWNPFLSRSDSGGVEFEKCEGNMGFVFGANQSMEVSLSSNSTPSTSKESVEKTLSGRMVNLNIGGQGNQSILNSNREFRQNFGNSEFGKPTGEAGFNSNCMPSGLPKSAGEKLPDNKGKSNVQNFGGIEFGNADASAQVVFGLRESSEEAMDRDLKKSGSGEGTPNLGGSEFGKSSTSPDFISLQSGLVVNSNTMSDLPSVSEAERLPAEMRKLKIEKCTNNVSGRLTPNSDWRTSGYGEGPPNMASFEFGKSGSDAGVVFGPNPQSAFTSNSSTTSVPEENFEKFYQSSGVTSNSNFTPEVFQVNVEKMLPIEMSKLKIGSEEAFLHKNGTAFNFEASQRVTLNSSSCANLEEVLGAPSGLGESALQDELKKLNIESKNACEAMPEAGFLNTAERQGRNLNLSTEGVSESVSKFGNNRNINRYVSGQHLTSGLDEYTGIKLPNEMSKLNIKESGSVECAGSTKYKGVNTRRKEGTFVFGSSKNPSGSFSSSLDAVLPEEMRKLNIGSIVESATHRNSQKDAHLGNSTERVVCNSTIGSSIPAPFTFQAGKKECSEMGTIPPVQVTNMCRPSEVIPASSSTSSIFAGCQPAENVSEDSSTDRVEHKDDCTSTVIGEGLGLHPMDPPKLKLDASWSSEENLFPALHMFSMEKGMTAVEDTESKKRMGKLKLQSASVSQKHFLPKEENSEMSSPGGYSPMDFSPYQETLPSSQFSQEPSLGSNASSRHSVTVDSGADLNINEEDTKRGVKSISSEFAMDDSSSRCGTESLTSQNDNREMNNDTHIGETGISGSSIGGHDSDGGNSGYFSFGSADIGGTDFTFAASSSCQAPLSSLKHHIKNKSRIKGGQDSYISSPSSKTLLPSPAVPFFPSGSLQPGPSQGQNYKKEVVISQKEVDKKPEGKKESISATATSAAAQEACEKWRLRGNQAYANGKFSQAEDYYTRGICCVSPNETSRSCMEALMLCYCNRVATRMALGRMKEALEDCLMAATIGPNFPRAQLRAAKCYLALGQSKDALKHFKNCLLSGSDQSVDQKIVNEASEGLQKAKQVAEHMDRSTELLQQGKSDDATKALEIISEALSISPYSENLIEMKAQTLLRLRKYEKVVQLCEQTLDSAEKNCNSNTSDTESEIMDGSESITDSSVRLWRWHLMSKSYFYLGRLEEALDLLQKVEHVGSIVEKYGSKIAESSRAFAVTVRELLRHKGAGNEAFQAGRHLEAVEHYTAALACSIESRPFAAICFCNRAAAYQAVGQITDAIADCSLAIALDSSYPKAISRRATLHEMIRDYGHAIIDLQRLINLLEKQADDSNNQLGQSARSTSRVNDLRQARTRLVVMEEEARKGVQLDMYLILGVSPSDTAGEIKKAYRKAALRHHPDKAGQFMSRSENGDDGLWKEVAEEVHKDADRLFKMIGEAYALISHPAKRLRYDEEEDARNAQKKGSTPRTADAQGYPFEKSGSSRHWKEAWKTYGNPQQRW